MKEIEEIKVGEYVRTENQGIFIISHINSDIVVNEFSRVCLCQNEKVAFGSIKEIKKMKHSKNPIDIIEVGDVIRYRIKNIPTILEIKGFIEGIVDISDEEQIENIKKDKNYEILSIVTHEQFSNIEYRLEN